MFEFLENLYKSVSANSHPEALKVIYQHGVESAKIALEADLQALTDKINARLNT